MWNSVTGNVEKGETPEQAIVRELKEEIGFVGEKPEFITTRQNCGIPIIHS